MTSTYVSPFEKACEAVLTALPPDTQISLRDLYLGDTWSNRQKAEVEAAIWTQVESNPEVLRKFLIAKGSFSKFFCYHVGGTGDEYAARNGTWLSEKAGCDVSGLWDLLDQDRHPLVVRALAHCESVTRDVPPNLWVEKFEATLRIYLRAITEAPKPAQLLPAQMTPAEHLTAILYRLETR